jgi:hypothetical protein
MWKCPYVSIRVSGSLYALLSDGIRVSRMDFLNTIPFRRSRERVGQLKHSELPLQRLILYSAMAIKLSILLSIAWGRPILS